MVVILAGNLSLYLFSSFDSSAAVAIIIVADIDVVFVIIVCNPLSKLIHQIDGM